MIVTFGGEVAGWTSEKSKHASLVSTCTMRQSIAACACKTGAGYHATHSRCALLSAHVLSLHCPAPPPTSQADPAPPPAPPPAAAAGASASAAASNRSYRELYEERLRQQADASSAAEAAAAAAASAASSRQAAAQPQQAPRPHAAVSAFRPQPGTPAYEQWLRWVWDVRFWCSSMG